MTPISVPYDGPNGIVTLTAAAVTPGVAGHPFERAGEYSVRLGRAPAYRAKIHRADEHAVNVDAHAQRVDREQAAAEQPSAHEEPRGSAPPASRAARFALATGARRRGRRSR